MWIQSLLTDFTLLLNLKGSATQIGITGNKKSVLKHRLSLSNKDDSNVKENEMERWQQKWEKPNLGPKPKLKVIQNLENRCISFDLSGNPL